MKLRKSEPKFNWTLLHLIYTRFYLRHFSDYCFAVAVVVAVAIAITVTVIVALTDVPSCYCIRNKTKKKWDS